VLLVVCAEEAEGSVLLCWRERLDRGVSDQQACAVEAEGPVAAVVPWLRWQAL
jgi:hypothetical protein